MAYRLQSGEEVVHGLRRIVDEELAAAAGVLTSSTSRTRDEAIHEARKSIKKTRAIVRLVSVDLEGVYQVENRRLRDLGRTLSEYRDTAAMIEIFDQFQEKFLADLGPRVLGRVRQELVRQKSAQGRRTGVAAAVRTTAMALSQARERAAEWPLAGSGLNAIAQGLEKGYRRGRKALESARHDDSPECSHEWRKRVKDHWYHVRLLEDVLRGAMADYERNLKDLETWLGDHHNLEVLYQKVAADPGAYGGEADVTRSLERMRAYQRELRRRALGLGERLYETRPREFLGRVARLWRASEARVLRPAVSA